MIDEIPSSTIVDGKPPIKATVEISFVGGKTLTDSIGVEPEGAGEPGTKPKR